MSAGAEPSAPASPDPRRSLLLFIGISLLAAVAVLVGLRLTVGVNLDAPTLALTAACVVMIWGLRAMWGVVVALARPTVDTLIVEAELGAELSTAAELREEKRRVLRAIKELEFDHDMGKLSDEDFRAIGDRYKLRAIEVMRQLDDGDDLHPQLLAHIRGLGLGLEHPRPADAGAHERAALEAFERVSATKEPDWADSERTVRA